MQGRRSRRSWVGNGRAHIEVRGLSGPRSGEVAAQLQSELERLRRLVGEAVGPPVADLALALGSAFAQALGQGPLGLIVDLAHRSTQVAEIVARRRVWAQREPQLHATQARNRTESAMAAWGPIERPRPL